MRGGGGAQGHMHFFQQKKTDFSLIASLREANQESLKGGESFPKPNFSGNFLLLFPEGFHKYKGGGSQGLLDFFQKKADFLCDC